MAGRKKSEPGEKVWYTPGGKLITHGGSGNAYSNYGCRCRECMDANTDRYERRREERRKLAAEGKIPSSVKHGTDATYTNWGCSCDPCREAHAEKCRDYYQSRKLEAEGGSEAA